MLQALIGPVTGILDKFIEDKDQKAKLAHEIATMAEKHAHEANMAQVQVNQVEAQHRSSFVAGWRPLGMRHSASISFCVESYYCIWYSIEWRCCT